MKNWDGTRQDEIPWSVLKQDFFVVRLEGCVWAFLSRVLSPLVFKKIKNKKLNILKNASKQIIKSLTITPSCTFYHEARKVTGRSAFKIQIKFICLYYKGWQTNISPVSAKLCVLLNKTTAQKKRGPERGEEGGPKRGPKGGSRREGPRFVYTLWPAWGLNIENETGKKNLINPGWSLNNQKCVSL